MIGVVAASREAWLGGRGCCICHFLLSGGRRTTTPPPTKQYRKRCVCVRVTPDGQGPRGTALPDAEQPRLRGEGLPRRWVIRGVQVPSGYADNWSHSSHGTGAAQLRGLLHSISGFQSQNWCFEQEEDLSPPCFSLYMARMRWSGGPRVVHSQKRQLRLRSDLDRSLKSSGPQFLHWKRKE